MLGEEVVRNLEAQVMLRIIDTRWMAHLQDCLLYTSRCV